MASPLRNSPQTLSCGPGSRSNSTTLWPRQREAGGGRRPGETAAGDRHVPAHAAATVRKRIASAVSPGPKASAQPGRAGPRPASSRASTNMTVAELMLP